MCRLLLFRKDTLESNENSNEWEGEDVDENIPKALEQGLLLAFGGHLQARIKSSWKEMEAENGIDLLPKSSGSVHH